MAEKAVRALRQAMLIMQKPTERTVISAILQAKPRYPRGCGVLSHRMLAV